MKSANKIRFPINFKNPRNFFMNLQSFCLFLFNNYLKENMITIKIEVGREAALKPSVLNNINT